MENSQGKQENYVPIEIMKYEEKQKIYDSLLNDWFMAELVDMRKTGRDIGAETIASHEVHQNLISSAKEAMEKIEKFEKENPVIYEALYKRINELRSNPELL